MSKRNDITGKTDVFILQLNGEYILQLDGEYFKDIPQEIIDDINEELVAKRHGRYNNNDNEEVEVTPTRPDDNISPATQQDLLLFNIIQEQLKKLMEKIDE